MLSRLRTVLRESYVGHVMCASFLVFAVSSIGQAFESPVTNISNYLFEALGSGMLSSYRSSTSGLLVTIEVSSAVVCTMAALLLWRWLFGIKEGAPHDGTN